MLNGMKGGEVGMDREKVIEILEKAKTIIENWVPMFEQYNTPAGIDDAIALLKEKGLVKPIFVENPYTHLPVSYCPQCREPIDKYIVGNPYKMTKFCHYCGQAVKWE